MITYICGTYLKGTNYMVLWTQNSNRTLCLVIFVQSCLYSSGCNLPIYDLWITPSVSINSRVVWRWHQKLCAHVFGQFLAIAVSAPAITVGDGCCCLPIMFKNLPFKDSLIMWQLKDEALLGNFLSGPTWRDNQP